MVYFGLSEENKERIEHIAIIHSYDEYTPEDFLSTEDYSVVYSIDKFKLVNWLADLEIDTPIDKIVENNRDAFEFLFSKHI